MTTVEMEQNLKLFPVENGGDGLTKVFRGIKGKLAGSDLKRITKQRRSVQKIGEFGAGLSAKAKGLTPTTFKPGRTGIDQIYKNGDKWVILEAKGGTSTLAQGQMSKNWIQDRLQKAAAKGDPVAKQAFAAFNANNNAIQAMVVKTKIVGDKVLDPIIEFKDWSQIGQAAF